MPMTVLDTRPAHDFLAARLPDSVNIPVDELAARVHELPAGGVPIALTDRDPARAAVAATFLRERGHPVDVLPFDVAALTAAGTTRSRLWQPNPFLVDALSAIASREPDVAAGRTAVDIACGTGRDAVYLALSGFDVTAVDHLPDALTRAADLAARYGVSLRTVVHDIERVDDLPPGGGPYDLACVFRYLHRPLWPALRDAVRPGGYVAYETFHDRNLKTGRSPRNPDHLLRTGELADAFAGFEILIAADAVERDGRYFSHILARRPA
jgi:SAM-dependent methyltransferase